MLENIIHCETRNELCETGLLTTYIQKDEVLDLKGKKKQRYTVLKLPYNPVDGKPREMALPYRKTQVIYRKRC